MRNSGQRKSRLIGARAVKIEAFFVIFAIAAMMLGLTAPGARAQQAAPAESGVILSLNGPVTPANAQYLAREIEMASAAGKELIVIEVDTPGGLVDSMKSIIKAILASDTPVATYVSPQGARSASAGLYIMYAAHISAMAPSTNTGAATPVELGGGQPSGDNPFDGDEPAPPANPGIAEQNEGPEETTHSADDSTEGDNGEEAAPPLGNDDALRAKVINDSVAYIRALAEERGRNADWAEAAVREAASITARQALDLGVIDYVADDITDLMAQIDGVTVQTANGAHTLSTADIKFDTVEPTMVEKFLGFFANPNVAVILMSLATTGIIIEMWNPGSIFPGALGLTCLVLGLYALQVLPHDRLPLALMGIGAILIAVEAYTPTFGLAGLAGLGLIGGGMYFLFPEEFRVSTSVIGALVASVGALLGLTMVAVVGSRSHGPLIGGDAIRKREGVVDDWNGGEGWVIVEGERWRARADKPLAPGDKIKVVEIDGLVLIVKQAKAGSLLGGFVSGGA
ncbi:MAG: nodulation protein NfeD [Parvularculaceae bacterium]|nr:nodulation protein NfeD [Parvularculaceae bacterium]